MRTHLALLLSLMSPALAQAQERIGTRLDWGTVEVVLYPTEYHGVQISMRATGAQGYRAGRGVAGGFEPESVFTWMNAADRVIHPARPPSGPQVILLTPVLLSAGGDSIRLYRRADGSRWSDRVIVAIDAGGPQPDHVNIQARPEEVGALLAGLQREASLSGFNADSVARIPAPVAAESIAMSRLDELPALLQAGPLMYPDRSVSGRVMLDFVVRSDGSVDPSSVRAIYADDTRLVEWARQTVLGSRFSPGRIRGAPVAVLVRQAFNFHP